MKKLLSITLVCILVISGLGAVVSPIKNIVDLEIGLTLELDQ